MIKKEFPFSKKITLSGKEALLLFLFVLFSLQAAGRGTAAEFESSGQITGWGTCNKNGSGSAGLRFLPQLSFDSPFGEGLEFGGEFSLNLSTSGTFHTWREFGDNASGKLYRSWLRVAGERFDLRFGLQRINFGPARLLRSLQWFDSLDPRDPLDVTDGVWGILARAYFPNNSTLWIWGLYGNDKLKGLEQYPSDEYRPEYGFRFQIPVPKGEMAFTYHNRRIDREWWKGRGLGVLSDAVEDRYALDGTFDLGIGLWFEAALSRIRRTSSDSLWTKYLTVGADYTLDIGTGIHVLGEHFIRDTEEETFHTTAVSIDYSLGILDTITFIGYFDWQEEEFHPNLSWQRTLDDWLLNVTAFSNGSEPGSVYSGTGILVTISYNF